MEISTCLFCISLFNALMELPNVEVEGGLVIQVCVNITPSGKDIKLLK